MTQIRDVMTSNPKTCSSNASITEAAKAMSKQDVGPIPVVDGDRLVGLLTDRDIVVRVVAVGQESSRARTSSASSPRRTSPATVRTRRQGRSSSRSRKTRSPFGEPPRASASRAPRTQTGAHGPERGSPSVRYRLPGRRAWVGCVRAGLRHGDNAAFAAPAR
jgi:hypothetical protein